MRKSPSKNKRMFFAMATITTLIYSLACTTKLYAAGTTDEVIIAVQENYPEYFEQNDIIGDAIRFISWLIISLLRSITNFCINLYDHSLGFMTLISKNINDFIPNAHALFTAILAVCLMATGVMLIVRPKKKPDILVSLLLIVIALSFQTWVLTPMTAPTQSAAREIAMTDSYTDNLISSHIHDLLYIDETLDGGLADLADDPNIDIDSMTVNYSSSRIDNFDINEILNYENKRLSSEASGKSGILAKSLGYYTTEDDEEEPFLTDVYNGFGWNDDESDDFLNDFFYRYKVDSFEIILALIASLIVYLMMSYKVIRIVVEIVVGNILAVFYSANINGNQKVIAIFKEIINAFIVLLLSAVMIRIFLAGEQLLNQLDLSGVEYGFLLLFLAFAVIDGPNIIQRIVGVDAGISSELGKLFAASQLANIGAAGIRGAGSLVGATFKGGKSAARKIAGAVKPNVPPENKSSSGMDDISGNNDMDSSTENGTASEPDIPPDESSGNAHDNSQSSDNTDPSTVQNGGSSINQESNPDIPPDMEQTTNDADINVPPNVSESPQPEIHSNGSEQPTSIGKSTDTVDLSRNTPQNNHDLAKEMDAAIDAKKTTSSISGRSGLGYANTTDADIDWNNMFDKGGHS